MKKTILITGASSGFGQGLTRELLLKGHRVIATMRGDEARFRDLYAQELKQHAADLLFCPLDVTQESQREALMQFIERQSPSVSGIDVLVNNAGFGLMGHVETMSEKQMRHQFEVNFFSIVLLTQKLLPVLSRTRGHIIQISSLCGRASFPHYGMYSATKQALEAFSEGLYFSKHIHGVDVTIVEPGGFRTDFTSRSTSYAEARNIQGAQSQSIYDSEKDQYDAWMKKMEPGLPHPKKVVKLLAALCESPKARGIFSKNKLRVAVGIDAKSMLVLKKILPDQLWMHAVQVISRLLGMP